MSENELPPPTQGSGSRKLETSEAAHSERRVISSADLFGQRHEVLIEHRGATYRLIITGFLGGEASRPSPL